MDFSGILFFVARAVRFSLVVCAVYAAVRAIVLKMRGRGFSLRREGVRLLWVAYLAALVEIIALRGGPGSTRELRMVPLRTTLQSIESGLWPFAYHFVGNIVWFVPLGMLLHRRGALRVVLIGAAVSALLEGLQWLLMTGVTDVDDVLVNALGVLVGAMLMRLLRRIQKEAGSQA